MTLFDLTGRTALITGAGSGIGLAIAQALAGAGARVVINGRTVEKVDAAVAGLRADGLQARPAVFDVTVSQQVRDGLDQLDAAGWSIDVLVNNAGLQRRGPLVDLDEDDWDTVIRTDLTSVFVVSREVVRRLLARGATGKIINIASLASHITRPDVGAYSAAKGGVRMLTQAMTAEWAPHGICVNALAPGHVKTDLTTALAADPGFDRWVQRRTPMRRWGSPGDLHGPAVFLASAASDYVNGQLLFVDGGTTAVM